jgi:hypothetical protein
MGDPRRQLLSETSTASVMETARAHHAAACELESRGDVDAAMTQFGLALKLDPTFRAARRKLARSMARTGRHRESLTLWQAELRSGEDGVTWVHDAIVDAMRGRDLTLAGDLAALYAAFLWGSQWFPTNSDDGRGTAFRRQPPQAWLSISKLQHDIEQFRYLQRAGVLGHEFDAIIDAYDEITDRLSPRGINTRTPLEPEDEERIGHVYNRIVHVAEAPRVTQALSPMWDRAAVERCYLHESPGVVVIDDFLSQTALESLRRFCLESTIWSGNRYADGRLGAFFFAGFNCPLVLQIAEEVREAFPRVIGDQYPLRQLWAFKNAASLPGDSTIHADFAAVNVNFWITPETANMDRSSGGLVVYDATAPLSWDFKIYNERLDLIQRYLRDQRARAITIPYRHNRAIIFNSDLFHATARIRFRPEYENRRVNITMLYGDRVDDCHHSSASPEPAGVPGRGAVLSAWRSNAFARNRQ